MSNTINPFLSILPSRIKANQSLLYFYFENNNQNTRLLFWLTWCSCRLGLGGGGRGCIVRMISVQFRPVSQRCSWFTAIYFVLLFRAAAKTREILTKFRMSCGSCRVLQRCPPRCAEPRATTDTNFVFIVKQSREIKNGDECQRLFYSIFTVHITDVCERKKEQQQKKPAIIHFYYEFKSGHVWMFSM